jgi:hypothetical protein
MRRCRGREVHEVLQGYRRLTPTERGEGRAADEAVEERPTRMRRTARHRGFVRQPRVGVPACPGDADRPASSRGVRAASLRPVSPRPRSAESPPPIKAATPQCGPHREQVRSPFGRYCLHRGGGHRQTAAYRVSPPFSAPATKPYRPNQKQLCIRCRAGFRVASLGVNHLQGADRRESWLHSGWPPTYTDLVAAMLPSSAGSSAPSLP